MTNWREEDHPRDPEGTTTGGRFTSKSRAGRAKTKGMSDSKKAAWKRVGQIRYQSISDIEAGRALYDEDVDDFEAKQVAEDRFLTNFSGRARDFFSSAIWQDNDPVILIVDNEGEVRAFFTGSIETEQFYKELGDTTYWIDFLGVADNSMGWGPVAFVDALRQAKQEATWQDKVLDTVSLLSANEHSNKFYEALGMHLVAGSPDIYYLTIKEVDAILKAVGD